MKKYLFMFLVIIIAYQSADAEIIGSKYEERHLRLIETEILRSCDLLTKDFDMSKLYQVFIKSKAHRVDNGVVDFTYETTFKVFDHQKNERSILVISFRADGFDHESQDWGMYSIGSIYCGK